MNAAAADAVQRPRMRPMRVEDLESVMDVERRAYPYPWSIGIFRDCLFAGYPAWVLLEGDIFIGHGVLSVAADEAHLLNVCVDPARQGRGYGRALLRAMVQAARGRGARRVFLEVRPSNPAAVALYQDEGFNEIGRRPRYYPADSGREDAIVMAMELFDDA
jgi:ribosomal-protein-alanine N-acetyltransferase